MALFLLQQSTPETGIKVCISAISFNSIKLSERFVLFLLLMAGVFRNAYSFEFYKEQSAIMKY